MTLNEAIATLSDEDMIRRKGWAPRECIDMMRVKGEILKYAMFRPDLINVREDDWEIYNGNT